MLLTVRTVRPGCTALGLLPKQSFRLLPQIACNARPSRNYSIDPSLIVNTLSESLQQIHAYTGLPWYAFIPLTTFGLRAIWTFPLAVLQRLRVQKQNSLRPIVAATGPAVRLNLAKKALSAATTPTSAVTSVLSPAKKMRYEEIMVLSTKEVRRRQKKLFKEHGVQLYKNFLLPLAQIPLWVCMSMTFRDLSGWSSLDAVANKPLDPTLYSEGALWFADLTILDPFHIFPMAVGIIALVNVEWTFKTFDLLKASTRRKLIRPTITDSLANVSRMAVVFLMAISLHAPSALTLYWLSSQLFSFIQNIFLDLMLPISFTPKTRLNSRKQRTADAVNVVNNKAGQS
ncbi:inner membrane protein COX18 [Metschnikowia aff. pulcherrima]|uniref:Inner membrane protein COX18 n=2 Tax=Metschnikowia TaxID=27320 RepID=A0A4P6XIJ9_9ASCO|nr:inner membrane protein COX18 [Metschnikowia aff. pulcherrima]